MDRQLEVHWGEDFSESGICGDSSNLSRGASCHFCPDTLDTPIMPLRASLSKDSIQASSTIRPAADGSQHQSLIHYDVYP